MNPTNPKFEQHAQEGEHHSVLDGREYIRGFPHETRSPVEEAREHPDLAKDCKSVLDGPACIIGLPH